MQYVRSLGGSVSKTWNSINPATLSGAIDVIVVEQEDGSLACSPFHVRFGKFSLLRPYEKKVEFKVNGDKRDYSMKLGEGGEAFFVFETSEEIPESMQTSPVISPAASPSSLISSASAPPSNLQEPEYLDLNVNEHRVRRSSALSQPTPNLSESLGTKSDLVESPKEEKTYEDLIGTNVKPISINSDQEAFTGDVPQILTIKRSSSEELFPLSTSKSTSGNAAPLNEGRESNIQASVHAPGFVTPVPTERSVSPPPLFASDAVSRAKSLSQKLSGSNIPSQITESGDLMLDMTGYKTSEDEALRAELIARKILAEELEGNYDIGALIGADEHGNLWIYSSEEAKDAAARKIGLQGLIPSPAINDAASDPGYQSEEDKSHVDGQISLKHQRTQSEAIPSGITASDVTQSDTPGAGDPNRNYAKTLRLTSDQLKTLRLIPGANSMSFSVNKATCQAYMYYWKYDVPIVISDIDGTITKSDALGHVLNMIGRDWTHIGVAKLYTDIVANGYNILYLTSRSVGQADTTRAYLNGISQEGYRLPKGPVIMSPDRTIAALRREIYLRKPEVFKMACLRDILSLFSQRHNPFYAGFGNRLTDALSYRSVNIPSTRIFTINSNAEVSLDLLTLNTYKSSYVTMRELVDQVFPPVGLLITGGGEDYTDFNYWREAPLEISDISDSDDEPIDAKSEDRASLRSEDEGSDGINEDDADDEMTQSYLSQESAIEGSELIDSVLESIDEGDPTTELAENPSKAHRTAETLVVAEYVTQESEDEDNMVDDSNRHGELNRSEETRTSEARL